MGQRLEFLDQLQMAASVSDLWDFTVHYLRARGIEGIGYGQFYLGRPGELFALFESGIAAEVIEAWIEMGRGKYDPAFRYIMATGLPVKRSEVPDLIQLSRQEQRHRETLEAHGLRETLNIPVFGMNNTNGMFVLINPVTPELFDGVNRLELQTICQAIHSKNLSLLPGHVIAPARALSERELEILRWVAEGKSNSVIAEILAISIGTVDTYMRRLFEKLDVTDRTSAAVKGVSIGLIHA
jgi:DNA-binding CsgD family transcriptional regulator